jgi:hypothetical protein
MDKWHTIGTESTPLTILEFCGVKSRIHRIRIRDIAKSEVLTE